MESTRTGSRIFNKTDKAREELADRRHGLPARLRQVLILVDGKRDVDALRGLLPGQDVDGALARLQADGYIAAPDTPATDHAVDQLAQAREYMISVAQSCLGLLATDLVNRIRRTTGTAQLAAVAGYWITAVRDSRYGGHRCEHYLEQLKGLVPGLWVTAPGVSALTFASEHRGNGA